MKHTHIYIYVTSIMHTWLQDMWGPPGYISKALEAILQHRHRRCYHPLETAKHNPQGLALIEHQDILISIKLEQLEQ